jgi:hypothetical protein
MTTPFFDSLSAADKVRVQQRSLGDKKPTYFDPISRTNVQITLDLEALLILLDPNTKKALITFAKTALSLVPTTDELELMTQVIAIRTENYAVINREQTRPLQQYDVTKNKVVNAMETLVRNGNPIVNPTANQNTVKDTIGASFITDLGTMFQAFANGYNSILRTDSTAIHDRLTDSLTNAAYQESQSTREQQLQSWVSVVNTYLGA